VTSFWDGFEKQAVTGKWVDTHMFSGLMRRAGENPGGQLMKRVKEVASDQPSKHWRQLFKNEKGDVLRSIRKMNRKTKKNPEEAGRSLLKELMSLGSS